MKITNYLLICIAAALVTGCSLPHTPHASAEPEKDESVVGNGGNDGVVSFVTGVRNYYLSFSGRRFYRDIEPRYREDFANWLRYGEIRVIFQEQPVREEVYFDPHSKHHVLSLDFEYWQLALDTFSDFTLEEAKSLWPRLVELATSESIIPNGAVRFNVSPIIFSPLEKYPDLRMSNSREVEISSIQRLIDESVKRISNKWFRNYPVIAGAASFGLFRFRASSKALVDDSNRPVHARILKDNSGYYCEYNSTRWSQYFDSNSNLLSDKEPQLAHEIWRLAYRMGLVSADDDFNVHSSYLFPQFY